MRPWTFFKFLLLFLPTVLLGFNMPEGVSTVSTQVYDLHMFVFYICLVIGIFVSFVLFWSVFRYRRKAHPVPAKFHESLKLEVFWTIVPCLILFVIGYPSVKLIIDMYDTSASEVDIQVTGYQWKWSYKYLNEGIEFFSHLKTGHDEIYQNANLLSSVVDSSQQKASPTSLSEDYLLAADNPLVLPVNTKIRFLTTSADVVHSWWVPELAVKKDAIPGFINETWVNIKEPGIYYGRCAELCGKGHAYMPISVQAVSKEAYALWVSEKK